MDPLSVSSTVTSEQHKDPSAISFAAGKVLGADQWQAVTVNSFKMFFCNNRFSINVSGKDKLEYFCTETLYPSLSGPNFRKETHTFWSNTKKRRYFCTENVSNGSTGSSAFRRCALLSSFCTEPWNKSRIQQHANLISESVCNDSVWARYDVGHAAAQSACSLSLSLSLCVCVFCFAVIT